MSNICNVHSIVNVCSVLIKHAVYYLQKLWDILSWNQVEQNKN